MRHNKKFNHLGRTKSHRDAMLSNMATSLILHKRIFTTLAKAKALRVYVEPLINRSKEDTTASRRVVFSYLQSKEAVTELFKNIAEKVADRPGGYTRILKTGNRLGDNAKTCFIELVDYNENMLKEKLSRKPVPVVRKRAPWPQKQFLLPRLLQRKHLPQKLLLRSNFTELFYKKTSIGYIRYSFFYFCFLREMINAIELIVKYYCRKSFQ